MTDLDRVGSSDNFNFRGVPLFLQVCEKRSKLMECLHSDISAAYLLIILVDKIIPFAINRNKLNIPQLFCICTLSSTKPRRIE